MVSGRFCAGPFAQNVTFSSKSETHVTVGAPLLASVSGVFWTGTTTTTQGDGANEDGNHTVYTGCNFMDSDMTTISCVGGLIGKTGDLAGRTGTVTRDSKSGASNGTGQGCKQAVKPMPCALI